MLSVGDVDWAGSVASALAPILTFFVLLMLKRYFPAQSEQIEKALSETESEIKKEIQNGVQDQLKAIHREVSGGGAPTPPEIPSPGPTGLVTDERGITTEVPIVDTPPVKPPALPNHETPAP